MDTDRKRQRQTDWYRQTQIDRQTDRDLDNCKSKKQQNDQNSPSWKVNMIIIEMKMQMNLK